MDFQPLLQNDLVVVKPLERTDFNGLFAVANNPAVWHQLPPRAKNRFKMQEFKKYFNDLLQTGTAFCILDAKTNKPIGTTKYYIHKNLLYMGGTFLGQKYWGGKYNRAFRSLLIEHAFEHYTEIHIHITADNKRNRRATSKLGFTEAFSEVFDNGYTYVTYKCTKGHWYSVETN